MERVYSYNLEACTGQSPNIAVVVLENYQHKNIRHLLFFLAGLRQLLVQLSSLISQLFSLSADSRQLLLKPCNLFDCFLYLRLQLVHLSHDAAHLSSVTQHIMAV